MKLKGKRVEGINELEIVFPRGNDISKAVVLRARAIMDWEIFDALCPVPKPKVKVLPGGIRELDESDPGYVKRLDKYKERRGAWIVIESLKATEGLEWETIDSGKPESWDNLEQELKDAGFSFVEIQRITHACMEVNALSDTMLDKARADFLSFQAQQAALSSYQEDEADSTPSGEPANASG